MLRGLFQDVLIEAGCDEAGRGCLAGPVFAAAVILPSDFEHPLLDDSKKMTAKNRFFLREIIEQEAVAWAVSSVPAEEIDRINILNASFLAMNKAVSQLSVKPGMLLIDGNRFKTESQIPYKCIVGGDGKFASIAAASVLAKTYRDEYMDLIDKDYPVYNWRKNKGYPTKDHRLAIMNYGLSKYHRVSFGGYKDQLLLF